LHTPKTYIVTGSRGVGKSILCRRIAEVARDAGLRVAGILTERESALPRSEQPGGGPGGDRYLVDLSTGDRTRFSRANPDGEAVADALTPGFRFDPGVFERGARALADATPCDLLVIDELGPLELLGDRGWVDALEVLRRGEFGSALVVCRPGLLQALEQKLEGARGGRPIVVTVTEENRVDLVGVLSRDVC